MGPPISFTFLNMTGMPELPQPEAKRMRAHITRTNFANRRQRIAESLATEAKSIRVRASEKAQQLSRHGNVRSPYSTADWVVASEHTDPYCRTQSFSKCWSLVFLGGHHSPRSLDEAVWIDLIASDLALMESSMAVGIRYWSPDALYQEMAELHSSKAANIIIQRIESGRGHTDAVLGAVLSMAFGERLKHNVPAWNIHIDGLVQLIKERRSKNVSHLPSWLCDLLILDSINDVMGFPRFYHMKVVRALDGYNFPSLTEMADLCDGLVRLRKSIADCNGDKLDPDFVAKEIEEPLQRLLCHARSLQVDDNPCIQATSFAVELIIHLSWRLQKGYNLTPIADRLKEALRRLQIRQCMYMDLTSWQLIIGAIASDIGSPTRAWFVSKLRHAVSTLRSRGWYAPLEILEGVLVPDLRPMMYLKTLLQEVDY